MQLERWKGKDKDNDNDDDLCDLFSLKREQKCVYISSGTVKSAFVDVCNM